MQCLGIPIDHRLRRLIREAQSMETNGADSKHIRLLYEFGTSLKVDEREYPKSDLSFGLEMARPESKGGLLIVLLRPHSTQNNSDGFLAGRRGCKTLEAVSDLITAVNNGKLGFDDISIFDAIPLLHEAAIGTDISEIIDDAHNVFANMVRAKNPDIVLCCFKTETRNTLVQQLRGRGVGVSFNDDKSVPIDAGDVSSEEAYGRLKGSDITWLCCDIAWILEELGPEDSVKLDMPQQLLRNFDPGAIKPGQKSNFNTT
ncbi:hypothetical protein N7510_002667 [Penicillium lagena]|uniref:uncharacterized protein n=1 Tax=Penicillium lagena TaxID=94218 RepID=UPI00253FC9ED|nr:uncharacterized protein N7510_002667 [Penicillium lagena]KAJ5626358.1 hypothetical protein N7510_002667 [Penicillium lagena]